MSLNSVPSGTPLEEKMVRFGLGSSTDEAELTSATPVALYATYNDKIRPLLDAVDKLRQLKVMKEGIELPTIVVVGDQSSGKSSVLESLAGISLPRGIGICTRVPLVMRLQQHSSPDPELHLEFNNKEVPTDEAHVAQAIEEATKEIAGDSKGISHTPITLVVKKKSVPDLTMVDLPGITRVPVRGQPEDIYEQISNIIMEYITPKESIILNVLSATVDFPTCESIRMSQRVDRTGERTLAVVTKADQAPEGLLEKVTADDVNIGLGYVCVRNRIGEESYEEARSEEKKLFESHLLLSKINKSIVGIPVLAQKLVQIQATSLGKCLPDIVRKINQKLSSNVSELNKLPKHLSNVADAMTAFMQIIGSAKESLKKILIRGEFDEYPKKKDMHCTARMADMLNGYSKELDRVSKDSAAKFLMEETKVLEEAKGIELPNFLPRTAFLGILQRRVKEISNTPVEFVEKVWNYIESVVVHVLTFHSESYPQLQSCTRRAALNLILKMKDQSVDRVIEIAEMEKLTDYTCNPKYMSKWSKLIAQLPSFMENFKSYNKFVIQDVGEVEVEHLRGYHQAMLEQAFDMRMRIIAYWEIVLQRLVDNLALHLVFSVQNLVNREMEKEIVNELMGPSGRGIERLLEESPSVATKRERLNQSIKLLRECKEVLGNIMDRIEAPNHSVDVGF
ncbi:dynamin-related protein 4C-like [Macadamia integrifolia]|uniref:dynamin-related protein 4C-like n=1 Tax=Macadamia integrifolia TaxID=60698 RepID=UPI001C4EB433|nr:dynamin-related protein 4C-like [Macadamia integrifolia]